MKSTRSTFIGWAAAVPISPFASGAFPIRVVTDAPATLAQTNDQSDVEYMGTVSASDASIFQNGLPVFGMGIHWHLPDDPRSV